MDRSLGTAFTKRDPHTHAGRPTGGDLDFALQSAFVEDSLHDPLNRILMQDCFEDLANGGHWNSIDDADVFEPRRPFAHFSFSECPEFVLGDAGFREEFAEADRRTGRQCQSCNSLRW